MAMTLSSKGQVVIPKKVREQMGWHSGQRLELVPAGDQLRLVPVVPLKDAMGILGPPGPPFVREKADRPL